MSKKLSEFRCEKIGNATLYLGDCLEVMKELDPVDCVVTDPPYELTYGGHHCSLGGKLSTENYDNKGGLVHCKITWDDFMPVLFEILRENAHAYVMSNNRHVQNLLNSADNAGFKFHNLLVWNKGTATPNRWYMKNLEFTGFFYKGKAFFINDCGSTQLHNVQNITNEPHPTSKPSELMSVYIKNSTKERETVLDPFMGIGSTIVAAARSGRRAIGIELLEKHFEIACQRIQEAYDRPDMFVEAEKHPEPKQEELL